MTMCERKSLKLSAQRPFQDKVKYLCTSVTVLVPLVLSVKLQLATVLMKTQVCLRDT